MNCCFQCIAFGGSLPHTGRTRANLHGNGFPIHAEPTNNIKGAPRGQVFLENPGKDRVKPPPLPVHTRSHHPNLVKSVAMRHILAFILALSPAPFTLSQTTPSAQPTTDSRIASLIDGLAQMRTPNSVSISPDGATIAWAFDGPRGSELHLTPVAATKNSATDRIISPDTIADTTNNTPGACSASHPNWSPNGKQLAFLSDCSGSDDSSQPTAQDNIFIWTSASNAVKQVSHLHGAVSSIQWSLDGKSIAFLYVENATRHAGALDAMKPWNGVYGEDGVEVQRVYGIDVASGHGNWFTPENLHVYEFSWAPVPHEVVFVAAAPPGENNWWVAKLYIQGLVFDGSGRIPDGDHMPDGLETVPIVLFDPSTTAGPLHNLQIAVPRFSPDGKQIAFIGGLMSDQGSIGGDIYLIPATGLKSGEVPRDLTANRPASPAWITWLDDRDIGISEHVGGSTHITYLNLETGKDDPQVNLTLPETIIAGTDVMSISGSDNGIVALIRQSFDHGPEVWAGPLDHLKQITHLNDQVKPAWGKSESIDYTNEGLHIQGWLIYPANYDPQKKYPLIVSVHGGPSSAMTPRWPTAAYGSVPFSALGYFVFMPNPRGSFGQGEKFTQANIKDFGYGDLRDVLAGVDVLEKRFPIDKDREGITGWSYGGFMTMFAVTQTTRFKAAVAGAGLANWQSYYGENSIDQWMVPFFGATVYDDPKIYAKSSPIEFIKNVKTPTLVVVGDRDGECPAPQSFEFWHALREQGVKTQLVIYPNEGHHFVDAAHQHDVLKRALDWFETEMPAK
jgi:dipeptidyl aminopeptidase/acylaminoacyl peptidase